jgi:hypothetical protein
VLYGGNNNWFARVRVLVFQALRHPNACCSTAA